MSSGNPDPLPADWGESSIGEVTVKAFPNAIRGRHPTMSFNTWTYQASPVSRFKITDTTPTIGSEASEPSQKGNTLRR